MMRTLEHAVLCDNRGRQTFASPQTAYALPDLPRLRLHMPFWPPLRGSGAPTTPF